MKKTILSFLVLCASVNAFAVNCTVGANLNAATEESFKLVQDEAANLGASPGLEKALGIIMKIGVLAGAMNAETSTLSMTEKGDLKMVLKAPDISGIDMDKYDVKNVLQSYEKFKEFEAIYTKAPKISQDLSVPCEVQTGGFLCKDTETRLNIDIAGKIISMFVVDDKGTAVQTMFRNQLICE